MCNSANIDKDFQWLESQNKIGNVCLEQASTDWALIAVQGPTTKEIMQKSLPAVYNNIKDLPFMHFCNVEIEGQKVYIARTGYTGEYGFEIYAPCSKDDNSLAKSIWIRCTDAGATPIGLGARDTLRLEASLLLYGNDINKTVNPIEAGIRWAVDFETADFIGKAALLKYLENSAPRKKLYCFKMSEKAIARSGMDVYKGDQCVGKITSGSHLPTLELAGGFAWLSAENISLGDEVQIDIRGKRKLAMIAKGHYIYLGQTKGIGMYPSELQYSKDHEWVKKLDGNQYAIGVTDYAIEQLGDIVHLELPDLDSAYEAGESFATIESTKTVSDIYLPITGTISAINEDLVASPEVLQDKKTGDAWLVKVKSTTDLGTLLSATEYEKFVKNRNILKC